MLYLSDPTECERLACLCDAAETRRVIDDDRDNPTKWYPERVFLPGLDVYFTPVGSWEFVAKLIREKYAIRIVELRSPFGTQGFQMKMVIDPKRPELYVKLALNKKGTIVIGRSFHYSDE